MISKFFGTLRRRTESLQSCGLGQEAQRIAKLLAPSGAVTGMDKSDALVAEAHRRTQLLNVPATFQVGDALALDFADNTFDRRVSGTTQVE